MRIRFTILFAGLFSSGECGLQTLYNENEIERHMELLGSPSSKEARKLGVGLAPTEVPYEPPGFKPTTTPTDRTKKPTRPPSRIPTSPIPTQNPTEPYPCALCRPNEKVKYPMQEIYWDGSFATCRYVRSLGDLTERVGLDNCQFYRNLGKYLCMCTPTLSTKKQSKKPSKTPTRTHTKTPTTKL